MGTGPTGSWGPSAPARERVLDPEVSCRSDDELAYTSIKSALGVAALSATRSKDTYFLAKYRRLAARRGPIKAVVAIEHAMLVAIWNMLSTGATYQDLGSGFYLRRAPDRTKTRALKQLRDLDYEVTLEPICV